MTALEFTQANGFALGRPEGRPAIKMDEVIADAINKLPMDHRIYPEVYAWQVSEAVYDLLEEAGLVERCHYCRIVLMAGTKTKDHIVPRSKGGLDASYNLVPACMPCNSRKSNDWPDEQHCSICSEAVRRFRVYVGMLPVRNAMVAGKGPTISKTAADAHAGTSPEIVDVNQPKEQ